ncbi:response regulator [Variovorax sp. H27-G14]|uniref:response regulator n=1 Tax=Variovorax sp. H27-G14 TaxID=3111914 RepID=UPI0038FC742D
MTLLVFLVEDDPAIRASLVNSMSSLLDVRFVGHATSEQEAIHWLTSHRGQWNLAVVDLFIEGGTGFSVMASISRPLQSEHVVALTNSATPENKRSALQCGAHAVFDKTAEIGNFFVYCESLEAA